MGTETVVFLVIVGVIVAAVALHLIAIAASLGQITSTLTKLKGGVVAIKGQTDPVGPVIGGLAGDVAAIDSDLVGLLEAVAEAQAAADAEPPPPPPPPARKRAPAARATPAPPVAVLDKMDDFSDVVDFEDEEELRRPTMAEAVARARAGS
jgi:hypothetical protein